MTRYAKPRSVDEALILLSRDRWRLLAGGTDFYPAQGARPIRENVLDLNGLPGLRGIVESAGHWVIGARTTWTDMANAAPPPAFDALRQAAREVGAIQIQNVGTVAGNLCNASPAADGTPPLLVLDAQVELRSLHGSRMLSLPEFLLGNRRTAIRPDELITAIHVPKTACSGRSAFVKLGARRYLVISIAMAAARIAVDRASIVTEAAIAVGACSAVAQRLAGMERSIVGTRVGPQLDDILASAPLDELSPIDDVRGGADYRLDAAREIVARAVAQAAAARPAARAA
ncbi:MAG: xanthine dehydrogenase family protein subunit M [Rhizobiaceae bacterium]|nr:xanthine dehydrogenase family protein subunit M [Rhizobiaceae bacterium]